jgi:hypothetical protein
MLSLALTVFVFAVFAIAFYNNVAFLAIAIPLLLFVAIYLFKPTIINRNFLGWQSKARVIT